MSSTIAIIIPPAQAISRRKNNTVQKSLISRKKLSRFLTHQLACAKSHANQLFNNKLRKIT
jgi:hypothetical protein